MTEQILKYVMTVCYDDNNAGYVTRTEIYTSDDYTELESLYRYSQCFKKGCCGCSVRNSKGKLLFGYEGRTKFVT